ncbi:flavin-containing monooxygenase [Caenimonas aquaedulcis]|uniref:NAD(P)/FAD-dependent oxidoreductase n=1 Tax=Caenimonas aquaedulcis TaxID=2793270 RepID=A0A931MJ24_9BURK|nr:NAD(P)/FAD-dependent oxidoreductase [Caenimonas aquaedulcis]MBG9390454.1 NAD(P)/FAD-dependent oxidoreductase [Caenimonas aquaedulcis]
MTRRVDAVVVGAGFGGIYMLHKLLEAGMSVAGFEAGADVGGTWFWNRYPGARCDVESLEYSYSFSSKLQQAWRWPERYSSQPEILRYAAHVADELAVRPHIAFSTRVTAAVYDEAANTWTVETDTGDSCEATYLIMATGCLSTPSRPKLPGLDRFSGKTLHTGEWPHEPVDLGGLRVGVIGTGSSGIQIIPELAGKARHLHVFQRTANYCVPARNEAMDPDYEAAIKARYDELREIARASHGGVAGSLQPERSAFEMTPQEREAVLQARWDAGGIGGFTKTFNNLLRDAEVNEIASEFVRRKIREIVKDPAVAARLCPRYMIGTKRLCAGSGYFETYNRDNVTLVDIAEHPLVEATPAGLRTDAAEYALDAIVFATGFDAMTGSLARIDIRTSSGVSLRERWQDGPRTYMGLMTAGLPNFFHITGPGSPSVLSNVILSIEQHVEWIADLLVHMRHAGMNRVEADEDAQERWVVHADEVAKQTLLYNASSWYTGANIPGKPRVFMPYLGGHGNYRRRCDEVARSGYPGFHLSRALHEHRATSCRSTPPSAR